MALSFAVMARTFARIAAALALVLSPSCGGSSNGHAVDAAAVDAAPVDAIGAPIDAGPDSGGSPGPDGAPGATCGGIGDPPCAATEFCDWSDDTCGFDDSTGTCQPRPTGGCPRIYAPVCGCDHVTYGNVCEANQAGQDVLYAGECATEQCGGIAGLVCSATDFCDWTPDSCGVSDQLGDCRPRPTACPDVVDPVCGCDGMTYGNECEANAAGMDIIYSGPCM